MNSDSKIQADVTAELSWEPSINSAQIGVEVSDGIVTLSGHVGSYSEKWDAERAAQRVAGVKAMTIELEVKLPGLSKRNDVDIARSAGNVLDWTTSLPEGAVKVMVDDGWVTLSGDVDWGFQRDGASAAVRRLMGVTGVTDDIVIRPKLTMNAVKADIEAALNRRAWAHTQKISVEVNGSDVILSGTVDSWSERELATQAAWGTPGVRKVVDNLTVAL